jgi:hypothetical protein
MDNVTLSHIRQIIQASQQGKLVVFIGSGISANSGVPTWNTLIKKMKEEMPEHTSDETDYLKIAQLYKELRGEKEYLARLKEILRYGKIAPNELHKSILDLNPCHIITTNYDNLLEQACSLYNKQYYVVCKDDDLPNNNGEKMLIKMHGDFDIGNIVLTENDYFDYSTNFPLIRAFVISLFASKVVLFVGFSFSDINLKYILRQVKNVLHDKMQKAYLITSEEPNPLIENYYNKKGVCIVSHLTESTIDASDKSEVLKTSLRTLLEHDPYNADIIDLAMSFWEEYSDQVSFLGKYLRYIIPQKRRKGFWLNAGELSLPSYYEPLFKQHLSSTENIRKLREKYGDKINKLLVHILNNEISSIEDINLLKLDPKALDYHKTIYGDPALESLYKLDLIGLCEWLREHQEDIPTCSKKDLRVPYILYKTGRFFESYVRFKELAPLMWKSQKYFLYFVCLYNMKTLARILNSPLNSKPYIASEQMLSQVEDIDLQKILMELPLNDALKQLLNELFSFQYVTDIYLKSIKLKQQIAEHRKLAENGGTSFNDNVGQLLYTYHCFFDFGNENYIIHDVYTECQTLHAIVCEGIIDSIMIRDENHPQSKLTMLPGNIIKLFLFSVQTQDLQKILKSHATKKIPASKDFKDELISIVENLGRSITDKPYLKYYEVTERKTIVDVIERIILLCTYIEEPPILPQIYPILNGFNEFFRKNYHETYLTNFIRQQKPSAENAITLINHIKNNVSIYDCDDIASLIAFLSDIASDAGLTLDITSVKQLSCYNNTSYVSSFYKVVDNNVKKDILEQVVLNAKTLYDYVMAEMYSGAHLLTSDIIDKFKNSISTSNPKYFWTEETTCHVLVQFIQKEEYSYLKESVEKLAMGNDCLRFILSPLTFNDTAMIQSTWLQYCSDDDLQSLLKKEEIRNLAKDFCSKYNWDTHFKDRVWRLM